jgi:biotin operon repressor
MKHVYMKILFYIDRINLLHKLITKERTGTPSELAKRLSICESRLYRVIEELKHMGLPIEYCRKRNSYYYTTACELNLSCNIRILSENEANTIEGGFFLSTAFFVEWPGRILCL